VYVHRPTEAARIDLRRHASGLRSGFTMTSTSRLLVVRIGLAALAAGCGRARTAPAPGPLAAVSVAELTDGFDASVRRDVESLRVATDAFHDLAAAGAAGYPTQLPRCVADSTMGGMGHHLVNRPLFDEKLEIAHPEMLIYAPDGTGKVELVGVEYAVPYRALPATATPPRLFGQELKRYDQFNYWALHVWAWKRNRAGLFADWNPAVHC
jgi:hypothetical protein